MEEIVPQHFTHTHEHLVLLTSVTKNDKEVDSALAFYVSPTVSLEIFDLVDVTQKGFLSQEDVLALYDSPQVVEFLDAVHAKHIRNLLHPHSLAKSFRRIDRANTGQISRVQWVEFVSDVQNHRFEYFRQQEYVRDRCYWGKGQESSNKTQAKTWCLPRGFVSDFVFYTNNNHPLVSVFKADPINPFSRLQRLLALLAVLGLALCLSGVLSLADFCDLDGNDCDDATTAGMAESTLLLVSLPVALVSRLLGFLCSCSPCAVERTVVQRRNKRLGLLLERKDTVASVGLGALVVITWVVGVLCWASSDLANLWVWGLGAGFEWLAWFVVLLLTKFNPFLPSSLCKKVAGVHFGKWTLEREKAWNVIHAASYRAGEQWTKGVVAKANVVKIPKSYAEARERTKRESESAGHTGAGKDGKGAPQL